MPIKPVLKHRLLMYNDSMHNNTPNVRLYQKKNDMLFHFPNYYITA